MSAVMYNCKRCKLGRRVEYDAGRESNGYMRWPFRRDEHGAKVFPGAHVQASGGGKPTVYGGDPLGLCQSCGRVMQWAYLKANYVAEVACNAKCTGARGPSCDCSCNGKNHGGAWSQLGSPLSTLLTG